MDVLPTIGLGTSRNGNPDQCSVSVQNALKIGYRHIDTAQGYGNESYVGTGLRRSTVPREQVVLATKLAGDALTHDGVVSSTNESLRRLGVDTIDIIYVHWPTEKYDPAVTLPALDELWNDEKIRYVGVSNFSPAQTEEAIRRLDAPLIANQVEMHPLLPPRRAHLESAIRYGYSLVAYAPFCRTDAFNIDEIERVADRRDISQAQTILAWLWSHDNVVAIPKATDEAHLHENYRALDVELNPEDIREINSIDARFRKFDRDDAYWNQ